jgi:hypothetical protein
LEAAVGHLATINESVKGLLLGRPHSTAGGPAHGILSGKGWCHGDQTTGAKHGEGAEILEHGFKAEIFLSVCIAIGSGRGGNVTCAAFGL